MRRLSWDTALKAIIMQIACIAWGSLLWKPEPLKLLSPWHAGGPELPLEFARDSDDSDELAIVLCEGAALMPTFYGLLDAADVTEARAMLAEREKIHPEHPEWIGTMQATDGEAKDARIAAWLALHHFDAVVWTAVPPKFSDVEGRMPSADEAVAFLSSLSGTTRQSAEDYVRQVPATIRTAYRIRFERDLGWTPREE